MNTVYPPDRGATMTASTVPPPRSDGGVHVTHLDDVGRHEEEAEAQREPAAPAGDPLRAHGRPVRHAGGPERDQRGDAGGPHELRGHRHDARAEDEAVARAAKIAQPVMAALLLEWIGKSAPPSASQIHGSMMNTASP